MSGVTPTLPKFQFSANGVPMVGGTLETYVAGTTTPAETWQDQSMATSNGTSITLDARGECLMWFDPSLTYKLVLKNASGVIQWTVDNVQGSDSGLRAALAATTGSSLIGYDGGTAQDVLDSAKPLASYTALRAYTGRATSVRITAAGVGGFFYRDDSDTTSTDDKGTVIVASNGKRWKRLYSGAASVEWFGADKTGATDSTTAIQAARDFVAAKLVKLVFPAGTYKYTTSPNWAIPDAQIVSDGEVILKCTGTSYGVLIDAGSAAASGCYNVTFGRFLVAAASTGLDGVYVRGIHHSTIDVKVIGTGTGKAGLRVEFAVCSRFPRLTVSANEGDMPPAGSSVPFYGAVLTQRNAGEACSYCVFDTPVLEGTQVGAYLDYALGNEFVGGTMEGCPSYGTQLTPNASNNKYLGVDFEANGEDVLCQGYTNTFFECDTGKVLHFDTNSRYNTINGGSHSAITIDSPAGRNLVTNVHYNKKNDASVLTDNGAYTRLANNFNYGLGINHNAVPAKTTLVVGASPYTYTNTTGNDILLIAYGGTVSAFTFNTPSGNVSVPFSGSYVIPSGHGVTVTYTATPTMIEVKK